MDARLKEVSCSGAKEGLDAVRGCLPDGSMVIDGATRAGKGEKIREKNWAKKQRSDDSIYYPRGIQPVRATGGAQFWA